MHLREYEGMTAEEIYPCLEDNDNGGERDLENNQKSDDTDNDEQEQRDDQNSGGRKKKKSLTKKAKARVILTIAKMMVAKAVMCHSLPV